VGGLESRISTRLNSGKTFTGLVCHFTPCHQTSHDMGTTDPFSLKYDTLTFVTCRRSSLVREADHTDVSKMISHENLEHEYALRSNKDGTGFLICLQ